MRSKATELENLLYNDVIRLSDLERDIARQKLKNETAIIDRWKSIVTPSYVKERIVDASAKNLKRAVLIREDRNGMALNYYELFKRSGLEGEISCIIDRSTICVFEDYTRDHQYYEIGVTWDYYVCNIL